jgi:hypothetical protein
MVRMRQRPWLLGFVGLAVGLGQAPTAVPYLTGLAMLSALHPRPVIWPLIVIAYWVIALSLIGPFHGDRLVSFQPPPVGSGQSSDR